MKRRLGCLALGVCCAVLIVFTFFGLALGHPVDQNTIDPMQVLFWVEVGILVVGVVLFIRAEMKDPEV